jgi:ligand-binding SRPBCC domain-containing protein
LYTFRKKQQFPASRQEVWNFIANPKNLATITPPSMGFVTISGDERPMFAGQIIHYTIKPLLSIKVEWVTEITHLSDNSFFVDEQRYGPYKFWHHKHFLKEIPGGVEMEDIIHYKLPMGILGKAMHPFLVKPKLEEIFEFRQKKLKELFGEIKTQ